MDREWADNISKIKGVTMGFELPEAALGPAAGPSSTNQPSSGSAAAGVATVPDSALEARRALLGGYLDGPRMLILCGAQGAGKSTFCQMLLGNGARSEGGIRSSDRWVHVSQDTISNGKRGPREKVEAAALEALQRGVSVVVDRTHLEPDQRQHFLKVARGVGVPADAAVLAPPLEEMQQRVLTRVDHPAGVQGASKVGMVAGSHQKLLRTPPLHAEGFHLVSWVHTPADVERLTQLYRSMSLPRNDLPPPPPRGWTEHALHGQHASAARALPSLILGTMNIRNDCIEPMLRVGFAGLDTASTYKNEIGVGKAMEAVLADTGDECVPPYLIVKVPGRADTGDAVRSELRTSLGKLRRKKAELLLLHWPAYAIEKGTLGEVWSAMEAAVFEGEVEAIGVCNFSPAALAMLLPLCKIRPALNQVERHPLLPQWALLEYCLSQRIVVQAHSPLGGTQGRQTLLGHSTIQRVARESGLTPAQVVLQWNLRHGVAVTVKCSTQDHATQLLSAAGPTTPTLNAEQMAALDKIVPLGEAGKRWIWPQFMRGGARAEHYAW